MSEYTQDNRLLRIETPLGKDVLLLEKFNGHESVSDLFEFNLVMYSTNHNLKLDSLIGKKSTLVVTQPDKSERYINGIISSFTYNGTFRLEESRKTSTLSQYHATLSPWLWTLTLNRDCRIFQKMTVPDIIREILQKHKLSNFGFALAGKYEKREYCVQYRESDFNFASRLMEEEGIYYFFEHSNSGHKMIMTDSPLQFKPLATQPKVNFASIVGDEETRTFISDLQFKREMRSDRYELRDFNFRSPALDLTTHIDGKKNHGHEREIYDYPGEYETVDSGNRIARIRFEEEQAQTEKITLTSNGRGYISGFRFDLEEHPRKDFNRTYSILRVEHEAQNDASYRSSSSENFYYKSDLVCIPYPTQFRPVRKTPIPKVQGTQTAIVVGPKGEEIYVDKHGRVKVQFHWDRLGKRNENSSCWIRVSQPWAGVGFGGITIPRIGQEVIVDFLEGDPDKPMITGRVYNGSAKVPYSLPANKAHSGIMSRSTPKGGSSNFNGVRMDDNIGAEGLEIQAEKDERILVKNDKQETVGNNETIQIGVDRVENVGNNESLTVGNDQQISIGNNRSEEVGNNEQIKIGSNRNTTIGDNDSLSVGLTRTHSVGINESINIGAAQEVSIGAVQIVSVGIAQINNIGLKQKTTAGKEIALEAPRILLTATEELTIRCGAGIITFDAAGNITIKSPLVKINC
jgi:type VI secretion system secreted protein VgrG